MKENSAVIRGAFADRLSDLIKDSGKKIDELAKEIGISTGILSTYQNDGAEAGITKLKKIADYFEVSCDYLLGGAECKTSENETIRKRTGLSDKAIEILESTFCSNSDYAVIINKLIENDSMELLCRELKWKLAEGIEYDKTLDNFDSKDIQYQLSKMPSETADLIRLVGGVLHDNSELLYEFRVFRLANILKGIVELTYSDLRMDGIIMQKKQLAYDIKQYKKDAKNTVELDANDKS